jgi:cell division transport system permease protein
MRFSSIVYVTRDGFRSIWRNKIMSIASISTVAISLFLLGVVWLFVSNVNNLVLTVESELEINAYIKQDYSREAGQALVDEIMTYEGVAKVVFIPKEEGIMLLESRFGNDADLAGTVGENNPLPDMIQIKAANPDLVPILAQKLEQTPGIDQVRYGQGMVEKLLKTADGVERASFFGLIIISLAAVFLISTSIRLAVFSRREEIYIMRLVGATNWYIRWPFLIEGFVVGLLGACLALGVLYFGYLKLVEYMQATMSFIPMMVDTHAMFIMSRNILLYGSGLGLLGSFLSVFRYLRV